MFFKIKILLILNIAFLAFDAIGQISFLTNEQRFIKEATEDVLYIIRQDYILKDTTSINPNEYGLQDKDYFGRIYQLAILSEKKLWCHNKVKTPWFYDKNYDEYKNDSTKRPVLSNVSVRKINEREFKSINTEIQTTNFDTLLSKLSICRYALDDSIFGIPNMREIKEKKAWVILASTKENISTNDSCEIILSIYQMPTKFSIEKLDIAVEEPNIKKNLLGGIFFNEKISLGNIALPFTGILNERILNWYISAIPNEPKALVASDTINKTPIIEAEENNFAIVKFIHKEGFAIKNICKISSSNSREEFCTDENGSVKIPIKQNESKILISINGQGAICLNRNENHEVICIYSKNKFIPKKSIKKCK